MTRFDYTSTLTAFEDAEQAHQLTWPDVTLAHDDAGIILAGPLKGQAVQQIIESLITPHLDAGRDAVTTYTTLRPWWRLWTATRAIRISVRPQEFTGFEQAFDDGGSHD